MDKEKKLKTLKTLISSFEKGLLTAFKSGGGFTLLEVILAISVLTIAVGGSFALIQQTLISASLNQSKLIASCLTQEGLEIVRNIRDNNWLKQRTNPGISWDDGLTICQPSTNCCEGDYQANPFPSLDSFSACDFGDLRYLKIGNDGFFSYSGDTPTKFKRRINISKINDDKLEVSVEVQWDERGRTHNIKAVEHLYNWYGY